MSSKLADDNILSKRFDVVRKMYCSKRNVAENKELIFNWIFEQIKNYQIDNCSHIYQLLWKTFYDILLTEKENSSCRIFIKSEAVTLFLDAVTNYPYSNPNSHIILQSIATFIQIPTISATLIADTDLLFRILMSTLNIICRHCESCESLKQATFLACTILDVIDNLPNSNDEDKITIFTDCLKDINTFIYIADGKKELNALSDKFIRKMVNIIFNLKTKHFENFLIPLDVKDDENPNAYLLDFLKSLRNLLQVEDARNESLSSSKMCALLIKKMLATFLLQYRNNMHSLKVTALLLAVTGLDIPILTLANSCCISSFKEEMQSTDINIIGVSSVLDACCTAPLYYTSLIVPEGYKRPSTWLRDILAALLQSKPRKNKPAWLKCFHSLILISPSVLEKDILLLIKVALLNISVHSSDSKKQYCELFNAVIEAHLQLHQIPRFFVKLLLALTDCIKENSYGKFLSNGQLLPEILECVAKSVKDLPSGQIVELWNVFIETFSTLIMLSETNKSCMFFVTQLFSTVLLHARLFQGNIPSNVYSCIKDMIQETSVEIKKISLLLKNKDLEIAPFQRSILLLSHALGEVKLAYISYYEQFPGQEASNTVDNPFDFSLLYDYLNEDFALILESFLRCEDKILSVLVFQLLLQKVKTLQFKEFSKKISSDHMSKLVSVILESLEISSSAIGFWNSDLCSLNGENYGTVLWNMFLKTAPLIMKHLNHKDLLLVNYTLVQKILLNNRADHEAKSSIISLLCSEFLQEHILFQVAFISALWTPKHQFKKRTFDEMNDETVKHDVLKLNKCQLANQPLENFEIPENLYKRNQELCNISNFLTPGDTSSPKKQNINEIWDLVKVDSGDSYELSIDFIQKLILPETRNLDSLNKNENSPTFESKETIKSKEILETKNEILKFSKHELFWKLHTLELCNNTYDEFIKTYNALWKIIYKITLQTAPFAHSSATIVAYVGKLLKFFIRSCGIYENLSTSREMKLCALNMNRLLIALTRHKVEFSKLVPYLIADYIDIVHHTTLESNIKETILLGIFRLLDMCSEESIKMLMVNINYMYKEIYINLIKSYRQHKFVS